MENLTTNLLTKAGTNLLKTTGIILLSSFINQELRNSTRATNESFAQNIKYWRNKTSRT